MLFIDLQALLTLDIRFLKINQMIEKKDKLSILVLILKISDRNYMFQILLDMLMMLNQKKKKNKMKKKKKLKQVINGSFKKIVKKMTKRMTKRMKNKIDNENILNILRNVSTS